LTDLRRRRLRYQKLHRLFSRCMRGKSPAEPSSTHCSARATLPSPGLLIRLPPALML
jgi:hypothetical protein